MFKTLAPLRQKATLRRLPASPIRLIQSQATIRRRKRLESIYKPAFSHLTPGSPDFEALADSGRVWEDHFKPSDLTPWLAVQAKLQSTLNSVDKYKTFFKDRPELHELATRGYSLFGKRLRAPKHIN